MSEKIDFHEPQRQSLMGVLVFLIKNGRALFSALIIFIATADSIPGPTWLIYVILLVITALILVLSYLQYLHFTFHIENRELIVKSGVIFKEQRIIPFERIQSVHTHQNLIQQLLNLTGIKIDSAGSKGKELEIPALDHPTAEALQAALQRKSQEETTVEDKVTSGSTPLLRLDTMDLLKVGLTENHLRSGLLALAVVYGYYWEFSSYLEDYIETDVESYVPELLKLGLILVIVGAGVFFILSIVLSLINTFLRYFNFQASLEESVININSGLLKRNQYRVPISKIQYMVWQSNPLRRLLNFETASLRQAQSSEMKKKEKISIPACKPQHTKAIEELLYGSPIVKGPADIRANVAAYLRITLLYTSIPLIAGAVLLYFTFPELFYLPLLLIPIIAFLTYKYAQSIGIEIQEELLVIKKGWIFPTRVLIPFFKGQSLRTTQSIFIKRRKLMHLTFFTAAGRISIRYLPQDQVEDLYNYCLYRIESYRGRWM